MEIGLLHKFYFLWISDRNDRDVAINTQLSYIDAMLSKIQILKGNSEETTTSVFYFKNGIKFLFQYKI